MKLKRLTRHAATYAPSVGRRSMKSSSPSQIEPLRGGERSLPATRLPHSHRRCRQDCRSNYQPDPHAPCRVGRGLSSVIPGRPASCPKLYPLAASPFPPSLNRRNSRHRVPIRYNTAMSQPASAIVRSPAEIVQNSPVSQAPNGICYARSGEITIAENDLDRMIAAVPVPVAAALSRKAYYFVPLTVTQGDETVIADRYDVALSDNAVCHRNLNLGDAQCVFISTRLMDDKFSVAFEFYINVGHALVERAGVSQNFADLAWQQVESGVRGETSLDAWESRKFATAHGPDAEKFKNEYLAASFADAISIYLLSLYLDVDYYDLRERDYPLLAPTPMAERLRKMAEIFPPNPGFEFNIYYRRRG